MDQSNTYTYINELTDLLKEIDLLVQEKQKKELVFESVKTEFQKANNDLDLTNVNIQTLNKVLWYCIEKRCDPTQAKLMMSLDDPNDYSNKLRGSRVNSLSNYSAFKETKTKKKSWWKSFFHKKESCITGHQDLLMKYSAGHQDGGIIQLSGVDRGILAGLRRASCVFMG